MNHPISEQGFTTPDDLIPRNDLVQMCRAKGAELREENNSLFDDMELLDEVVKNDPDDKDVKEAYDICYKKVKQNMGEILEYRSITIWLAEHIVLREDCERAKQ